MIGSGYHSYLRIVDDIIRGHTQQLGEGFTSKLDLVSSGLLNWVTCLAQVMLGFDSLWTRQITASAATPNLVRL
jgi:hypothetical protein